MQETSDNVDAKVVQYRKDWKLYSLMWFGWACIISCLYIFARLAFPQSLILVSLVFYFGYCLINVKKARYYIGTFILVVCIFAIQKHIGNSNIGARLYGGIIFSLLTFTSLFIKPTAIPEESND